MNESWKVKVNQAQISAAEAVTSSPRETGGVDLTGDVGGLRDLAKAAPGAAVVSAYGLVIAALRAVLGATDQDERDAPELAQAAAEQGLVTTHLVETVQGLAVLKDLSRSEGSGTGLSVEKVTDYIDLTAVALFVIRTARSIKPQAS